MCDSHPAWYHPISYAMSQELGRSLRDAGSDVSVVRKPPSVSCREI
ncbi:hypothetical protein [Sphingopyxis granuli]